jgi:2-polyprenyl-3-methyl-5-hydroxy-6-metoxy-1,4-benzoquinol methylase
VDGLAENRAMRDAFRARVSDLARPGGALLDFGCGTGSDAHWYATHGHHVVAYDISAGMVDALRTRCADEIAAGRIVPVVGRLEELERVLRARPPLDVVAANFAVLNHLERLDPLFRTLASYLRPGGALIASLLNPLHSGAMTRHGWLKTQLTSWWRGRVTNRGAVTTHRHYLGTIRRMASPHFALAEVGHADAEGRWSTESLDWRSTLRQQFHFVVLRRCA